MPLPVAHGLLGASVVVISRRGIIFGRDWKALLLGAALAILPDCDFFFVKVLHLHGSWHRGFSHSLAFALAVGLLVSALVGTFCVKEVIVYGLATFSHGLLDFFTSRKGGVQLFWPLTTEMYAFGLVNYPARLGLKENHELEALLEICGLSLIELSVFTSVLVLAFWVSNGISAPARRA